LPVTTRLAVVKFLQQDCEAVTCKVDLSNGNVLIVVTIYRPPNRDITYMENVCHLLQDVHEKFQNSIIWIAGDLRYQLAAKYCPK